MRFSVCIKYSVYCLVPRYYWILNERDKQTVHVLLTVSKDANNTRVANNPNKGRCNPINIPLVIQNKRRVRRATHHTSAVHLTTWGDACTLFIKFLDSRLEFLRVPYPKDPSTQTTKEIICCHSYKFYSPMFRDLHERSRK